jgi:hypothetical protein
MLRFENVATPFTAFTVVVPESVPVDGLVPMAMVTAFVAVVTTFPEESSILTCTAGAIEEPAATAEGCTVNATFAGGGVTVTVAALMTHMGWVVGLDVRQLA